MRTHFFHWQLKFPKLKPSKSAGSCCPGGSQPALRPCPQALPTQNLARVARSREGRTEHRHVALHPMTHWGAVAVRGPDSGIPLASGLALIQAGGGEWSRVLPPP